MNGQGSEGLLSSLWFNLIFVLSGYGIRSSRGIIGTSASFTNCIQRVPYASDLGGQNSGSFLHPKSEPSSLDEDIGMSWKKQATCDSSLGNLVFAEAWISPDDGRSLRTKDSFSFLSIPPSPPTDIPYALNSILHQACFSTRSRQEQQFKSSSLQHIRRLCRHGPKKSCFPQFHTLPQPPPAPSSG